MSHSRAVLWMLLVTLLWSSAGLLARQVESAQGIELAFWRSGFTALALTVLLPLVRGRGVFAAGVLRAPRAVWLSGLCWSVMFTAFLWALTLTTVANVLVTLALGPLVSALLGRWALGSAIAPSTWWAIGGAGAGILWMYGGELAAGDGASWNGTLVALLVPLFGALNWVTIARASQAAKRVDLLPAVWIGAVLSTAVTLPLSTPLLATGADLAWLSALGLFQLAIPCLLVVRVAGVLAPWELSLMSLLEVVLGVTWVWLGGIETPGSHTLWGGLLVIGSLLGAQLSAYFRTR